MDAVVFDMDGVLFDTERISCECWKEAGEIMRLGDISEGISGCVGLNRNDSTALMYRLYGEDFPLEEFRTLTGARFRQRIEEQGIPLKEGVREILDYLSGKGYRIGLASSTAKEIVTGHLERTGLSGYFKAVVTGDMVEHSKPEPDIYLKACEELGAAPENAVAIEDSPNGIRAAYRAGMKPVMVPDLIQPTQEIEEMLFQKFSSLPEFLEYLERQEIPCAEAGDDAADTPADGAMCQ